MGLEIYERLKKDLISRLPALNVQFFSSSMIFYPAEQLYAAQRGYRYDDQGQSLLSPEEGGWQESWFVIGAVSRKDRPLFVDVAGVDWPVYAAEIGSLGWLPVCIAARFDDLLVILRWIGQLLYAMDEKEKKKLIQDIVKLGGDRIDRQFWQEWIMPEGERKEDYI